MLNVSLSFVHLDLHRKGSCTALKVQGRFVVRIKFLFFIGITALFAGCLNLHAIINRARGYSVATTCHSQTVVVSTNTAGYSVAPTNGGFVVTSLAETIN